MTTQTGDVDAASLTLDEVARGLERGTVVVLDLRDGDAFAAAHVPGSWSVVLADLPSRLRDPDDPLWQRLFARPGARPTAVVLDGGDTGVVAVLLAEVGLAVRSTAGGVRAWSTSGRPLNRSFGDRATDRSGGTRGA